MNLDENIEIFNETPLTLNQPFKQSDDILLVKIYLLEYQKGDRCVILVPSYIKKQIPIIIYSQKSANEFENAFINIEYQKDQEITIEQFKVLQKIHFKFFEIILFKLDENAQNIFQKFFIQEDTIYTNKNKSELQQSLYRDFRFKNYLFIPLTNPTLQIDLQFEITNFNQKNQTIQQVQKNNSVNLSNIYTNQLFGNIFKIDDREFEKPYFIYLIEFGSLQNWTLQNYIDVLAQTSYRFLNDQFTPDYFRQKLDNYYNLQFTILKQKSLKELIQSNFSGIGDNKEFNLFHPFQELCLLAQVDEDILNYDYVMGIKLPEVSQLDFQQLENFEKALVEKEPYRMLMERTIDPEMIKIYRAKNICFQGFHCEHFSGWIKNASILKSFERSVLINEMKMHMDLHYIDFTKILVAMTPKQMFKQMNYENFETIGDSILKFFTILYVTKKFKDKTEGGISQIKSQLVSNLNLRKIAVKFGYHYFMRSFKQQILEYIPPYYKINKNMTEDKIIVQNYLKPHVIGKKAIADQIESLIGAAYYTKQRLFESFIFLKQIQIYKSEDFQNLGKIMFERIEIDDDKIQRTVDNKKQIDRNINWYYLFFLNTNKDYDQDNFKKNIFQQENSQEINIKYHLQQLQDDLGYQYKNVNFLINSLTLGTKTFEKLELLGDAVLDLYCQLSLVKIASENDFKLFPEKIHSLKVFMLSFEPMSLFCYFMNLPQYIEFESQQQYQKVYDFLDQVNVFEPVKYLWNKNEKIAPKCISDAFEAFVGGIFLDGGFSAVKQILDQYFANFIYFYVYNFPFILIDIKSYIIGQYEKKGIQAQFKEKDKMVFLEVQGKPKIQYELTDEESVKSLHRKICLEFFQNQDKYLNPPKKKRLKQFACKINYIYNLINHKKSATLSASTYPPIILLTNTRETLKVPN